MDVETSGPGFPVGQWQLRRLRNKLWSAQTWLMSFALRPATSHETNENSDDRSGGTMDLRESKFYYAGHDMNFAVFSDYPCRVRYVESIRLPIGQAPVE